MGISYGHRREAVCSEHALKLMLDGLEPLAPCFVALLHPDGGAIDVRGVMRRYPSAAALLTACAEFSGSAHLGLMLAQTWPLPAFYSAESGPPVSEVFHSALLQVRSALNLDLQGQMVLGWVSNSARISYVITDDDMESGAAVTDFEIAMACRILSRLLGPNVTPERVELPRRAPRDPRPYRRAFNCPVAFNASVATIHMDAAVLRARTTLRVGRSEEAAPSRSMGAAPLGDLVARELALNIAMGEAASAARIAGVLGMGCRTLQRQLECAQTNFRFLSDSVRFGMAKRLLRDTDIDLTQMALSLGYSDVSVLTRAFIRWAGTCPSRWRASHLIMEGEHGPAPDARERR